MGPYTSAAQARTAQENYDRQLQAAREAFPEWRIIEALGGFVAVPRGTGIISAITLDGLVLKLRQHGA